MKSVLKREKARARRKDYEKKRNIHRNKKQPTLEYKKPVLEPVVKKDGSIEYKKIGDKVATMKMPRKRLKAGQGGLPESRKRRLNKKQKSLLQRTLSKAKALGVINK